MENIEFNFDDTIFSDALSKITAPPTEVAEPVTPDAPPPEEENAVAETAEEPSDAIQAHLDFLKEFGLLSTDEDVEPTIEGLSKVLDQTKKNLEEEAVQNLISKLPPDFVPLLQYALTSPQASIQDYLTVESTQLDLASLDLTREEDQKLALRMYYEQTSSHPSDRIDRMIARIDTDELATEAKDAVLSLQAFLDKKKEDLAQEAKQKDTELQQARADQERAITTAVNSALPASRAKVVQNFMLSPLKVENQVTTRLNYTLQNIFRNPEHLVQLADILADYDNSKGLTSTRLEKKAASNVSNNLRQLVDERLASSNLKTKKAAPPQQKNKLDLGSWLEGFEQ